MFKNYNSYLKAMRARAILLTALREEYQAVRDHLTDPAEELYKGTIYERGNFSACGRDWQIAISEIGPHNERAASEAQRAIDHFNPDVALFVGVAGGIKGAVIGDVVAASKVYGYESGKASEEFLLRPEVYRSSYSMEQRAMAVARRSSWLKRIKGSISTPAPRALIGPIAAGSKVVSSTRSATYKFLRMNYNDALAVEMEGLGFLSAAHLNEGVAALVVRGISDLIDHKEESDSLGSQRIASRNAAAFTFEVLATLELGSLISTKATAIASVEKISRTTIASNGGVAISGDSRNNIIITSSNKSYDSLDDIDFKILEAIANSSVSTPSVMTLNDALKLGLRDFADRLEILDDDGFIKAQKGSYADGMSLKNGIYAASIVPKGRKALRFIDKSY
jgi:nucleoside phosphorylase